MPTHSKRQERNGMLGSPFALVAFEPPSLLTCSGSRFHLSVSVGGTLRDFGAEGFQQLCAVGRAWDAEAEDWT